MRVFLRALLLLFITPVMWLLPSVYIQEYEGTVLRFDDGSIYVIRLKSSAGVLESTSREIDANVFGYECHFCCDDVASERLMVDVTGLTDCDTGDYVRVLRLSSRYRNLRMFCDDFWNQFLKYWIIPPRGDYGPFFAGGKSESFDFREFPEPVIRMGVCEVALLKAYDSNNSVGLSNADRLRLSEYYMSPARLGGLDSSDIVWPDE